MLITEKKLKYLHSFTMYGFRYMHAFRKLFLEHEFEYSAKWLDKWKVEHPDLYELDLTNPSKWSNCDDQESVKITYIDSKMCTVVVTTYERWGMYDFTEYWEAKFLVPTKLLIDTFKSNIDYNMNRLVDSEFVRQEEIRIKKEKTKIQNKLLAGIR